MNKLKLSFQIAIGLLVFPLSAQELSERVVLQFGDPSRPGVLEAGLINGSIEVRGTDGSDIVIEARFRDTDMERTRPKSEKSEGLRLIQQKSMGLEVTEKDNRVEISCQTIMKTIDLIIEAPRDTSLSISTVNHGNIKVSGLHGDHEVNNVNGSITMEGVSGSVVANTVNGEIKVVFVAFSGEKANAFTTMNGDIDVTLPAAIDADLKLLSQMGEIYSGFELDLKAQATKVENDSRPKDGDYRVRIENALRGKLGQGGAEISFESFHGNIFVRKGG